MLSSVLLFGGLSFFALSIYMLTSILLQKGGNTDALAWGSGTEPQKSKSSLINLSRPLIHNFTLQHAQKFKKPELRKNIERKILHGGLSDELNVDEFIGMKILWGFLMPLLLATLNLVLQMGFPYWLCVVCGLAGFYLADFYAQRSKALRYTEVVCDLPFFIDLMALSTEAGLDFINAMQRVVDKSHQSVLANEFSTVLKDIKLGSSRSDALKQLAHRLDIPEITSFCAVVIDADYTGASISKVLKDQSIQMRLERLVRAEKAGARASQMILLPMMLFILPAVFIMVFAPVGLQFMYGGN